MFKFNRTDNKSNVNNNIENDVENNYTSPNMNYSQNQNDYNSSNRDYTDSENNDNEHNENNKDDKDYKDLKDFPLKQYHQSLLKLIDLLEEDCIDEMQLKDIIVHLKNKANEITWTPEHEIILKNIAEKSICYAYLHDRSFKYFSSLHVKFTMPMFIITLLSGILMFISTTFENTYYFGIISGSINLIVATIQKIMEFVQPERFKIEHKSCSKRFQFLSNNIRVQLSLDVDEREPMPMYLTKTTTEYYNILQNSPELKDTILNNFKHKYKRTDINKPDEIDSIKPVDVYKPSVPENVYYKSKKFNEYNNKKFNQSNNDIIRLKYK